MLWTVVSSVVMRNRVWQGSVPSGRVLVAAFAAGLLLYLYRYRIPLSKRWFGCALVVGLALSSRAALGTLSLPFVAYCTVYLGMFDPPKKTFLLRGDYSYGLYLFGFPLQQTYSFLFPGHLHWWADAGFAIALGLAYAAFSWHLIEKPILARRNQIIARVAGIPRRLFSSVRGG